MSPLLIQTKTTFLITTSVAFGAVFIGYFLIKRYQSKKNDSKHRTSSHYHDTSISMTTNSTRIKRTNTPSTNDRNSKHFSTNIPSFEIDIISGIDRIEELNRILERALPGLECLRNRSDKDRKRYELFASLIDRIRILEKDLNMIIRDGGYERESSQSNDEYGTTAIMPSLTSPLSGAGTLSVLSDDSFMSAYEDLDAVLLDDADVLMRDPLKIDQQQMLFYQNGIRIASLGEVNCRKCRAEFCGCDNEIDFKAKLWCLRQAFDKVLSDQHNRVWLAQSGRQLIADLLKHSRKDPTAFYSAYDSMIQFLMDERNMKIVEEELKQRRVVEIGFWDVMIDFVLIDSFEDLSHPPSAVIAVTRNMILSNSMKESTLSTVIWSMLKAKRSRLSITNGFISHFYDISEVISPVITLGFLGTDEHMRELCQYFKEQTYSFIVDIFNVNRVRYTSLEELCDDVWMILRTRIEMIQTRLSTELLPIN